MPTAGSQLTPSFVYRMDVIAEVDVIHSSESGGSYPESTLSWIGCSTVRTSPHACRNVTEGRFCAGATVAALATSHDRCVLHSRRYLHRLTEGHPMQLT